LIGIHKEGNNNRYNKGLFLNYPLKEFIQFHYNNKLLLKKFNEKYIVYIKNNKTNKLILGNRYIGNEGLKELSKIELKELKELYLNSNDISDINILENAKFEKLEILNLGNNKIFYINILEKVNFKGLKELYLYNNIISDIKVFENVKFYELKILDLSYNKISYIKAFKKTNLKELKELYLNGLNILDLNILEKIRFKKLERLYLYKKTINGNKNEISGNIFFSLNNKNINYLWEKIVYNSDNFNKTKIKNDINIDNKTKRKSKGGISFENTQKKEIEYKNKNNYYAISKIKIKKFEEKGKIKEKEKSSINKPFKEQKKDNDIGEKKE